MKNFNRLEKTLFSICAIIFALFSYFLYDDSLLFPNENQSKTQLVGQMDQYSNDVRRKGAESFLWRPVSQSQKLYQKDSLFTGDASQAMIKLNDGSLIQVKENTLITLNFDQGQLELDLKFGDLSTQLAKSSQIQIKSGIEKFQIGANTKSKVEIKKPRSQKIKLNLVEGTADLKNKKQTVALKPNLPVQVKSSEVKVEPTIKPQINLAIADQSKFNLKSEKQGFVLKWNSQGVDQYKVQISSTPDFRTPLYDSETKNKETVIQAEIKKGDYFWKVVGLNEDKQIVANSAVYRFSVDINDKPVVTTPTQQAQLEYEFFENQKNRFAQIDLGWNSTKKYSVYEWQLSTSSEFSQIAYQGNSLSTLIKSPQLKNEKYYLRVRGVTAENESSLWSDAIQFQISFKDKKLGPLNPPQILTKQIFFDPIKTARNPASVQAPQVLWKKDIAALKYEIEIAKSKDFKGSVSKELKESQFAWSQYQPGKYYFRVSSSGQQNLKSPPSEVGTIEVKYSALALSPIHSINEKSQDPKAEAPTKDVALSWSSVPKAEAYLIEFDQNKDFKNPQKREVAGTSAQVTIEKTGEYHFRVAALDKNKNNLTGFSSPEKMTYNFKKPLASPVLSQPKNDMTVFLQQDIEPFIWLNWESMTEAKNYELEISEDASFKKSVIKQSLTENKFLIKQKIPLGDIYWRVRAIHKENDLASQWSEPRVFHLFHKKNENNFQ